MPDHTINLPRCCLDDVLSREPVGHRGTWYSTTPPDWQPGDMIAFVVYGDVEQARGRVMKVEQVPEGETWGGWFRTVWEEVERFVEIT